MAPIEGLMFWIVFGILTVMEGKETTVTCTDSEECVLPCLFQSDGKGARIMWYKKKAVVSCTRYGDTDFVNGHNSPADLYKGRTGLYADQVLQGNATLLLRDVTPRDQGKYFCITMTAPQTDESGVISLVVKAPVRKVDIKLIDDIIICSSSGIHPAPELTWSTVPPFDVQALQNSTKTQRDKLGFYNITSSQRMMGNNSITYVCSVTGDSSKRTGMLKNLGHVPASLFGEVMIPCYFPETDLHSFNLTWKFKHEELILSINISTQPPKVKVQEQWKDHVALGLLTPGSLQLNSLTPNHQGMYTCEVSTTEETYVTIATLTIAQMPGGLTKTLLIVIAVMAYFLVLSYGTLLILGCRFGRQAATRNANTELEDLNKADDAVEIHTRTQ